MNINTKPSIKTWKLKTKTELVIIKSLISDMIVNRREKPYPKTEPIKAPPAESVAKRIRQTEGAAGTMAVLGELGTEESEESSSWGGVIPSESAVAIAATTVAVLVFVFDALLWSSYLCVISFNFQSFSTTSFLFPHSLSNYFFTVLSITVTHFSLGPTYVEICCWHIA